MPTKASLIIPSYNRGGVLHDTIRMAANQDHPDYEVIVVDQDPVIPDVVRQAIGDAGDRVRLIQLSRPNLPAARNAGVRAAHGDIIVFIDDDVIIEKDYVSRHTRHYMQSEVGGVVGLAVPNHPVSMSDVIDTHAHLVWAGKPVRDGDVVAVATAIGCTTSFRKQAIIDAGMCDESFTGSACGEDIDLGLRVTKGGYQILLDTNIRLIHLEAGSGGCENRKPDFATVLQQQETMIYLNLKHMIPPMRRVARRAFWHSYRRIALNRATLSGGIRPFFSAHGAWISTVVRAVQKTILSRRRMPSNKVAKGLNRA